jgi:hypothetical protein
VVPKSTNTEAVTAVDAEEKLTDEGDEEVQTESHPSQASKESAASENVQVHPVIIPVIGDIVPNPPINNEPKKNRLLFKFVQRLFVEYQQNSK